MKKRNIFIIAAIAATLGANGQINSPAPEGFLERGVFMYTDANYLGTLQQLRHASKSHTLTDQEQRKLLYYEALAVFNTDGANAAQPLFDAWLNQYPGAYERADVMMSLADCVFTRNYAEALRLYNEINPDALSSENRRLDLAYRRAFCLMKVADYSSAMNIFNSLASTKRYGDAAVFYKGYINYAQGNFDAAKTLFRQANANTAPGNMSAYYLAQIYFMEGDYNQALNNARQLLQRKDNVDKGFVAEANRIAGESLFMNGDQAGAIPYLEKYVSLTETPLNSTLYILGMSEYNNGAYEKAVTHLRPVTDEDDAMGQNAYVYLGQALMKQGDTNGAIMAFDRALKMNHDSQAAENAYYNYAVAKYDGASVPFGSSVKVFEEFLTRYPNSAHANDVRQYIIAGYLTDNNYEAALASINRATRPNSEILAAKQRVLYTLGARDLAAGKSERAEERLTEAAKLSSYNAEYARQTRLVLGEAMYRNGNYSGAVRELSEFLANPGQSSAHNRAIGNYDLGYAYMAQKRWAKAADAFNAMLTTKNSDLDNGTVADAYNRLGDCRYYQKDWTKAAAAYDKAYATAPAAGDYALFQKAMMQGYAGNFKGKLQGMSQLIADFPTSAMLPDAMLEMTEAQLRTGDNTSALATWKHLIDKYPTTPQGRQAYLQMALTLSEMKRTSEAEQAYREIISKYPTSDEAAQAAEILKRQAADAGTLDQYQQFISGIDNAPQMDASEAERLTWNAAVDHATEKGDYSRMQAYLTKYPDGKYAAKATQSLLEHAVATENDKDATEYAELLLKKWPDNSSADIAYMAVARAAAQDGCGEDAMRNWKKAEQCASTAAHAADALLGVMRSARELGDNDELKRAATAILASSASGSDLRNEATFCLGLAELNTGDADAAVKTWTPLSTQVDDLYGSKAAVYMAQAQLDYGNTAGAVKTAEKFTQSDTPHTYWLARGFIVLSDALRKQGKAYEADEYLKAVRENYPGTEPDIYHMIDQRLKK